MSGLPIERLTVDFTRHYEGYLLECPFPERLTALITVLGQTVIPSLTELTILGVNKKDFPELENLLGKATKLTKLTYYGTALDAKDLPVWDVFTRTVAKQLQVLRFAFTQVVLLSKLQTLRNLGDKGIWPQLKLVQFGDNGRRHLATDRMPEESDEEPWRLSTAQVHKLLGQAAKKHGGWNLRLKEGIRLGHFIDLSAAEIIALLEQTAETRPPTESELVFDTEFDNLAFLESDITGTEFKEKMDEVVKARGRFSICFTGSEAPEQEDNVYQSLLVTAENCHTMTMRLTSVLDDCELDPNVPFSPDDYPDEVDDADEAFHSWGGFLELFLTLAKNMHTLRILTESSHPGGDIYLARNQEAITKLCAEHSLRHLEIDLAALSQPETNVNGDTMADVTSATDPHFVLKQLCWMSLPALTKTGHFDLSQNLPNLRSLTLHGVFLRREIEFLWLQNLTAKLKNIEHLKIDGIVFHANHNKLDDEDPEHDREEPEDEQDALENKMMAEMFLSPEFADIIRKQFRLTKKQSKTDPRFLQMMAQRDAMIPELERRRQDGTRKVQKNKYPDSNPTPKKDDAKDETESTDSGFGRDPRFAPAVDEKLRERRMESWLEAHFVNTSRKVGARCRDAEIRNMRVNATGLKPWAFVKHFEADSLNF